MGGQISIIKKHEGKITCVSGWANSFGRVVYDKDFFTDPNNESLKGYLDDYRKDYFSDKVEIDSYGLYIVDYDSKKIFNINGYSEYIDIMTTQIYLDEQNQGIVSPARELFDNNMICMRSIKSAKIEKDKQEPEYEHEITYTNLRDMEQNFESLDDVIIWLDGDRYDNSIIGMLKSLTKKKEHHYYEEDRFFYRNDMFIDIFKLGWKYYSYNEDIYGYFNLIKDLYNNGYEGLVDVEQWDKFLGEDDETGETFMSLYKVYLRDRNIKRIVE